jgi:hypothetical protein
MGFGAAADHAGVIGERLDQLGIRGFPRLREIDCIHVQRSAYWLHWDEVNASREDEQ